MGSYRTMAFGAKPAVKEQFRSPLQLAPRPHSTCHSHVSPQMLQKLPKGGARTRSTYHRPCLRQIGARGPLDRFWSKMQSVYIFPPYGRWEALHIFKRVPRCVGAFSAIACSILRTFNCVCFSFSHKSQFCIFRRLA